MAMTMVGVWGALRTGARLTRSANVSIERSDRVRAVQAFLRNYLGGAQPQAFVPAKDQSARMFRGDPRSLTYVAPMPAQLGDGGLFVQTLQFVRAPGSNDETLQLTYAPLSGDTASPDSKPEVLLEHVRDGGFEYLIAQQGNAPAKWQRTWHSTNGLPLAVHIVANPDWGGRVGFPEMLIPLRAGNGSGVPISLGAGR
jgi:general secretion pathway protein J